MANIRFPQQPLLHLLTTFSRIFAIKFLLNTTVRLSRGYNTAGRTKGFDIFNSVPRYGEF